MKNVFKFLFQVAFGPRTDVQNMNRQQLFRSATSFLIWALFTLIFIVTFVIAKKHFGFSESTLEGYFILFTALSFSISLFASLYLFLRWFFRSPSYIPGGRAIETGFFIDELQRIVSPDGPIGIYLNENLELYRHGEYIQAYIEDGSFYRCEKRIGGRFAVFNETGHYLNEEKKILARSADCVLPWEPAE